MSRGGISLNIIPISGIVQVTNAKKNVRAVVVKTVMNVMPTSIGICLFVVMIRVTAFVRR